MLGPDIPSLKMAKEGLNINSTQLEPSQWLQMLGLAITKNLSWWRHILNIAKTAYPTTGCFTSDPEDIEAQQCICSSLSYWLIGIKSPTDMLQPLVHIISGSFLYFLYCSLKLVKRVPPLLVHPHPLDSPLFIIHVMSIMPACVLATIPSPSSTECWPSETPTLLIFVLQVLASNGSRETLTTLISLVLEGLWRPWVLLLPPHPTS